MPKDRLSGFRGYTTAERKEEIKERKELNEEKKQEREELNEELQHFQDTEGGRIPTHEYGGDGKKQVDFFKNNSNHYKLIDKMDYNEREAFHSWARGMFMGGQQYDKFSNMDYDRQAWTRIYDKYLDQAVLNKGIVVARLATAELVLGKGNKYGDLKALQAQEGKVVISRGSMSCGVAKRGLTIGSMSKNVEYKIHIPKGKGAGMWIGDKKINGWEAKQREFMTNRDARFKVGKTTTRKDSHGRTIYVVNLTYDGHLEHRYD